MLSREVGQAELAERVWSGEENISASGGWAHVCRIGEE